MEVYKKLFRYVPEKKYLGYIAIVFSAVSAIITTGGYFFMYRFFKSVVEEGSLKGAEEYAILTAALVFGGAVLYFFSGYCSHKLGFRLETNLRKKGIEGLTHSSFRFFDLHPSGLTRKIIDDNAAQTHMIIAHLIPDTSIAVVTPIATMVLGFVVDVKVGAAIIFLTLAGIVLLKSMMGGQEFMQIYQAALEKLSAETVEYVRGIQVVKIFGVDVNSFKSLYQAISDYAKYAYEYTLTCKKAYVIFQEIFFGFMAIVIPIVIGIMDYRYNPENLAVNLIMIFFISGVMFVSFMRIMYLGMYAFYGKSAVEKLEKIYDEMKADQLTFGDNIKFESYDIEFENVDFSYGENKVFENLNMKLKEGKTYALVGSSGSGKTTAVKLISGFYKVDTGAIKIGGKPLESYKKEVIIKNISFVFQDAKLFQDSIYENVRIANRQAGREEIMRALELAECNSILEKFKDREMTVIGSKGVHLSGGEKQRIAIARAILKNSNIIIMDEASAALDPENEHELQLAFANLMKGKTVIMIAHRLTSIKSADEIIVMDKGKVIERGSDKELMAKDSKYRELQKLYSQANGWRIGA